jgi:hypothetical protein
MLFIPIDRQSADRPRVPPGIFAKRSQSAMPLIARPAVYHFAVFARGRLRRRTPGPPPFSSMNSTPAKSNARLGSQGAKPHNLKFNQAQKNRLTFNRLAVIYDRFASDAQKRQLPDGVTMPHHRHRHSFIAAFMVVTAALSGGSSSWITFQITLSEIA